MKKYFVFFPLLVCVIFTSCRSTCPPLTDAQKAGIEKQILGQWDKIIATIERADAESYSSYLSTDEFLGMYSQGLQFVSRDQYADTVKSWFGQRTSSEVQQKVIKVSVLSENLALLDQRSLFVSIYKDGHALRFKHVVSFIFKKEASGWMIIHGNESWRDLGASF